VGRVLKFNHEKGFTLVEVLVTVTLLGMIGAAVIGAAYVSLRSYNTSYNSTDEGRQARLAMERIVRDLRIAKSVTISSDPNALLTYRCYNDTADRQIYVGEDNRLYLDDGAEIRALTRLAVNGFNCGYNPDDTGNATIDITITVSDATVITSSVRMLNILNVN
jgi:prepilin-type N-terminal cleavage/methylation domain-containing protein